MSSSKITLIDIVEENGLESDVFGVSEISGDISGSLAEVMENNEGVSYVVGVIRHGKTVENIDGEDNPKGIEVSLIQEEIDGNGSVAKSVEKLIQMGYSKDNIVIYTANETVRINQTLGIICRKLGINFHGGQLGKIEGNEYIVYDERLKARVKGETERNPELPKNIAGSEDKYGQESLMNAMNRTAAVIGETVDSFGLQEKGKLHLFVGYRTMCGGFEHKIEGKQIEEKTTQAGFGEVKLVGLDKEKKVNKGGFVFDTNNFEKELEVWDKVFLGKLKKPGRTLFEYQNIINHYLNILRDENKQEILFRYMILNSTENIVKHGIKRLLGVGKKEAILDLLGEGERLGYILKGVLEYGDEEIIDRVTKYIVENDTRIFYSAKELYIEKGKKYIYEYYEKIYPRVNEIRQKSLDIRVRNGEKVMIDYNFDKDGIKDISDLINRMGEYKYIEGNGGVGKSYLLMCISELLMEQKIRNKGKGAFPVFFSLSQLRDISILEKYISSIESELEGEKIILLDSIDESEIDNEGRKLLEDIIKKEIKKGNKVIITSREGYRYEEEIEEKKEQKNKEEKINIEYIRVGELEEINIGKFVEEYFGGEEGKIRKFKELVYGENKIKIELTPLVLVMICEIIKDGKKIGNIKTIGDLYEAISDYRLGYWNQSISSRKIYGVDKKIDNKILEGRKKLLGKIAYELYNGRIITLDNLISIAQENDLEHFLGGDIESLNLIFKKNNYGTFGFVHESFYEYYFMRDLFEQLINSKGKEYKDFMIKFETDILANISYSNLDVFTDLFFKNGNKKLIDKFVKDIFEGTYENKLVNYIKKNNKDGSNDILAYKIYILGKLGYSEEKFNLLEGISLTELVVESLGRLGKDEDINYLEKIKFKGDGIEYIRILEILNNYGRLNYEDIDKIKGLLVGYYVKICLKLEDKEYINDIFTILYNIIKEQYQDFIFGNWLSVLGKLPLEEKYLLEIFDGFLERNNINGANEFLFNNCGGFIEFDSGLSYEGFMKCLIKLNDLGDKSHFAKILDNIDNYSGNQFAFIDYIINYGNDDCIKVLIDNSKTPFLVYNKLLNILLDNFEEKKFILDELINNDIFEKYLLKHIINNLFYILIKVNNQDSYDYYLKCLKIAYDDYFYDHNFLIDNLFENYPFDIQELYDNLISLFFTDSLHNLDSKIQYDYSVINRYILHYISENIGNEKIKQINVFKNIDAILADNHWGVEEFIEIIGKIDLSRQEKIDLLIKFRSINDEEFDVKYIDILVNLGGDICDEILIDKFYFYINNKNIYLESYIVLTNIMDYFFKNKDNKLIDWILNQDNLNLLNQNTKDILKIYLRKYGYNTNILDIKFSDMNNYKYIDYLCFCGGEDNRERLINYFLEKDNNQEFLFKYFYDLDFDGKDEIIERFKEKILFNLNNDNYQNYGYIERLIDFLISKNNLKDFKFIRDLYLTKNSSNYFNNYMLIRLEEISFPDMLGMYKEKIISSDIKKLNSLGEFSKIVSYIINNGTLEDSDYLFNFILENNSFGDVVYISYFLKLIYNKFGFDKSFDYLIILLKNNISIFNYTKNNGFDMVLNIFEKDTSFNKIFFTFKYNYDLLKQNDDIVFRYFGYFMKALGYNLKIKYPI